MTIPHLLRTAKSDNEREQIVMYGRMLDAVERDVLELVSSKSVLRAYRDRDGFIKPETVRNAEERHWKRAKERLDHRLSIATNFLGKSGASTLRRIAALLRRMADLMEEDIEARVIETANDGVCSHGERPIVKLRRDILMQKRFLNGKITMRELANRVGYKGTDLSRFSKIAREQLDFQFAPDKRGRKKIADA